MKKRLILLALVLALAWAVLLNPWTLSWNSTLCSYQGGFLNCSKMQAPEYKLGRPGKFDNKAAPDAPAQPDRPYNPNGLKSGTFYSGDPL